MGETSKAFERRKREGWFEKYAKGRGIDIGCGNDPVTDECDQWDIERGSTDATHMAGVADAAYDFVHASHVLEHLFQPEIAVWNWFRILKPEGYLIISVPSRRLYEKSYTLPSRWNLDHKTYWEPTSSLTHQCWTLGLFDLVKSAIGSPAMNSGFVSLRTIDFGYISNEPDQHASGEYSIEIIVQKHGGISLR